jgi:hypothetical protein
MKDRTFFNPTLRLYKNKYLELQSGIWQEWNYVNLYLKWDRKTDHAGFHFNIELFGLYFIFDIYDIRHWNWEENCWVGSESPITSETHPSFFNEDGTPKKFVSPRISTTE